MIESVFNVAPVSSSASRSSRHQPHDYERIHFHIASGDYFPHLATLLGFIEETLVEGILCPESRDIQLAAVRAARKDLRYLHEHFEIAARSA